MIEVDVADLIFQSQKSKRNQLGQTGVSQYPILPCRHTSRCMASCFFLLRQFEDVLVYLKSIKHLGLRCLRVDRSKLNQ